MSVIRVNNQWYEILVEVDVFLIILKIMLMVPEVERCLIKSHVMPGKYEGNSIVVRGDKLGSEI